MIKIDKNIFIVIGLGYGDEGKGSIVDYLTRRYKAHTVVRFNGGSQAAHHVVTPEGIIHCFAQFGSGTFTPGVKTFLSRYMLIDPLAIKNEGEILIKKGVNDCFKRLSIDQDCFVITPFHKIINQMLELSRGSQKHGSCGMGVGQAVKDGEQLKKLALRARDLQDQKNTKKKLKFLLALKIDIAEQLIAEQPDNKELEIYLNKLKTPYYVDNLAAAYYDFAENSGAEIADSEYLKQILDYSGNVIFEGAQGVLLDPEHGFWPYATKTKTTFQNAEKLIDDTGYNGKIKRLGVIRAYGTRHGAGPFVTEDERFAKQIPDYHNGNNEWQGEFRIGWFDLVATRYAIEAAGGVDGIAVTNLDRLNGLSNIRACSAYTFDGKEIGLLNRFFSCYPDGKSISIIGINVSAHPTRMSQSQLAELLCRCDPVYENLCRKDLIKFIEEKIKIPIFLLSTGKTAKDKMENIKRR